MKIKVLEESGYAYALFGIGLSYGLTSDIENSGSIGNEIELYNKLKGVADKLAHKGNGENKFLRQISVWLDITAPRYWWIEFDTYKIGTTAQSESTMHTFHKKPFTRDMFENEQFITDLDLEMLESYRTEKAVDRYILKNRLPESFLQRRIVSCNYAVLQNMIRQRYNHKLPEWRYFCRQILSQVDHPYYLMKYERIKHARTVDV